MNLFFILAFIALLATIVTMVMGIRSMTHGGEVDREASTRLMLRRVEFQAAALALILAGILVAGGWIGDTQAPATDRLNVELGVIKAQKVREQQGPDSPEATAYGGLPDADNAYLVTVAVRDRDSGERIEDAEVTASVGQLGLTTTEKELKPAEYSGELTFGNYFRMPKPGIYSIDVRVQRSGVEGSDLVRLEYHRPEEPAQ